MLRIHSLLVTRRKKNSARLVSSPLVHGYYIDPIIVRCDLIRIFWTIEWRTRSLFQATSRAARVGPWRKSTPGSICCRDRCPRWSTRWPAISDWSWACSSRRSTRPGRAPASRWCREPRGLARDKVAGRQLWSRDRRASRNRRRFRRATETGRFSPARRTACLGK